MVGQRQSGWCKQRQRTLIRIHCNSNRSKQDVLSLQSPQPMAFYGYVAIAHTLKKQTNKKKTLLPSICRKALKK